MSFDRPEHHAYEPVPWECTCGPSHPSYCQCVMPVARKNMDTILASVKPRPGRVITPCGGGLSALWFYDGRPYVSLDCHNDGNVIASVGERVIVGSVERAAEAVRHWTRCHGECSCGLNCVLGDPHEGKCRCIDERRR